MPYRWIFILAIIIPVSLACSAPVEQRPAAPPEQKPEPSENYVILLESTPITNAEPVDNEQTNTEYILIQGSTTRFFRNISSPQVSRDGALVCRDAQNRVAVYFPGDESPAILTTEPVGDEPVTPLGFGISPSGKLVFRIEIQLTHENGAEFYYVNIYNFSLDYRRDISSNSLFIFDPRTFDESRPAIIRALSQPLLISETGAELVYTGSEAASTTSTPASRGETVPIPHSPDNPDDSIFYIYDMDSGDTHSIFQPDGVKYSKITPASISASGRCILYTGLRPDGKTDLLVQRDTTRNPEIIYSEKSDQIINPRVSIEGGNLAFFLKQGREADSSIEGIVIHLTTAREYKRFSLKAATDAFWSDEIKTAAYISNSSESAVGDSPGQTRDTGIQFLHILDADSHKDTVVYSGTGGYALRILNIVANPDEFKDSTVDNPTAFGSHSSETGEKSGTRSRRRNKGTPGQSPSISTD